MSMTLSEAILYAEEVAKEQEEVYGLCPASESDIYHCDGTKDCKTLKNGKNRGCLKCAEEHKQLAKWLKELQELREQTTWIPCSEELPKIHQDAILSLRSLDVVVGFKAKTEPYFYCQGADGGYYIEPQNVLAWRPRPKPYKIENEEVEV